MLLDHMQVLFDPGSGLDKPDDRIRFMPVDAPELDGRVVEIQDSVFDKNAAEAYALGDGLPLCLKDEGVKVRCLSIPEAWVYDGNVELGALSQGGLNDDLRARGNSLFSRGN